MYFRISMRLYKTRLSLSSCIFSTFTINKSAPWGNFTLIYKKNHQEISKTKQLGAKSSSEIFWVENFWNFFEIENFWFFSLKIVWKWKKMRSKKIEIFWSQFSIFCDLIFFIFIRFSMKNFRNFRNFSISENFQLDIFVWT